MTYLTQDGSVQDSRPADLYEFTNTLGIVTRRTSYQRDIVFGGNTYAATARLKRGMAVIASGIDVPELIVELPMTDPLVEAYVGVGVVPQGWTIKITRLQRITGDTEPVFFGFVRNCDLSSKRIAAFHVSQLLEDSPETPIPNVVLGFNCQHTFMDTNCGVSRVANTIATTIVTVVGRSLVLASVAPFGTTEAAFGELKHLISGERRTIVEQNGTSIDLDYPLPSLGPTAAAALQAVEITRGCDQLVKTCRDRYNNVPNFGAHPNRPGGLRLWPKFMQHLKGVG